MAFLLPVSVSFQPEWLKIQYHIPDWPFVCVLLFVKPWCFILVVGSLTPIPRRKEEGTSHPQCSSLPALQESSHLNGFQFCCCCLNFWDHCAPLELELPAFWLQTCPLISSHMVLGFPQQFLSVLHSLPLGGVPYMFSLAWELRSCPTSPYYHLFCQSQT